MKKGQEYETRHVAYAKDQAFWADLDTETDLFGVFGTETGFCYATYASQNEARHHAEDMTRLKNPDAKVKKGK